MFLPIKIDYERVNDNMFFSGVFYADEEMDYVKIGFEDMLKENNNYFSL